MGGPVMRQRAGKGSFKERVYTSDHPLDLTARASFTHSLGRRHGVPHRYKVAQRLQHRIVIGFQVLVINLVVDDNALRFETPDRSSISTMGASSGTSRQRLSKLMEPLLRASSRTSPTSSAMRRRVLIGSSESGMTHSRHQPQYLSRGSEGARMQYHLTVIHFSGGNHSHGPKPRSPQG